MACCRVCVPADWRATDGVDGRRVTDVDGFIWSAGFVVFVLFSLTQVTSQHFPERMPQRPVGQKVVGHFILQVCFGLFLHIFCLVNSLLASCVDCLACPRIQVTSQQFPDRMPQ